MYTDKCDDYIAVRYFGIRVLLIIKYQEID